MLELCLLQSVPTIKRDGSLITSKSLKSQALLLYVFLAGEDVYRREYLASLLWEDKSLSLAQDNLRQALARIKKWCGDLGPAFSVERGHVVVDRSLVRVDTEVLIDKIVRNPTAINEGEVTCDTHEMFAGYEDVGSSFTSWTHVIRNDFERRTTEALNAVLSDTSLPSSAVNAAANLLTRLDPTNEEAVRCKMRHFATNGQQAKALEAYNVLYRLLDEQYDVEPTPETIELNAAIKLGEIGLVVPPAASDLGPRIQSSAPPLVCVAEFDIAMGNALTERMGNFFRMDILGNLSRFREWNVVDNTPLCEDYYRLDCQIEGHEQDIAVILTVRSMPDQRIVWSERFVTGFENWHKTQLKIAQQLALAINQSLTIDRIRTCVGANPEQRTVFDKWAICHSLNLDWSPEASNQVIKTLGEIIESAPGFNLAHSYLAEMHNKMHLVYPGVFRSDESVKTAVKHAKTAMNLDQLDCHAHRVFAWANTLNSDFEIGEFHFQQAYDLNPSNLYVSTSCALGFAYLDNLTKACAIADEIRCAAVPLQGFQWGYVQNIYYLAGRLEDAKAAGDLAGASISNLPAWQAVIHAELGEDESAKSCMKTFFEATKERWHGRREPSKEAIVEWLLHLFPMKNARKRAALFESMLSI